MDKKKNDSELLDGGLIKILILGDMGVGKTSLMLRYVDDQFSERHMPTIGVEFRSKTVWINNENILVQIWDTAGQERYRNLTKTYYKNASGIILACDCTKTDSVSNINFWIKQITNEIELNIPVVLALTKCDSNKCQVLISQAKIFAKEFNLGFFETSSKMDLNITKPFSYIIDQVISTKKN